MGNMDMVVMECMDIVAGKNDDLCEHVRKESFGD